MHKSEHKLRQVQTENCVVVPKEMLSLELQNWLTPVIEQRNRSTLTETRRYDSNGTLLRVQCVRTIAFVKLVAIVQEAALKLSAKRCNGVSNIASSLGGEKGQNKEYEEESLFEY